MNIQKSRSLMYSTVLFSVFISAVGCSQKKSNDDTVGVAVPVATKVTRENYMTGKQFCSFYSEITAKEHGRYIQVPKDYSAPEKGSTEIYFYTHKDIDQKLASYIFVDGGPGQNTHGVMPDLLTNAVNEIRFDQRGLGCSAPDSFDDYVNPTLYSSENTIRDMEEIRKILAIDAWSVYGVSYGTVPASLYAAKYPEKTRSAVLEGVVGKTELIHLESYKIEKLNIVVASLNFAQKTALGSLLHEESEEARFVIKLMFELFFSDQGMSDLKYVLNAVISEYGYVRRELILKTKELVEKGESKYSKPQQPAGVDTQIHQSIYCRELNYGGRKASEIEFNQSLGFYLTEKNSDEAAKTCEALGVKQALIKPYDITKMKIKVPVYYFQGSHDGATLAEGALAHFKTVPKAAKYFLLAQKGGHNPNLTRLSSKDSSIKAKQELLFESAILARPLKKDLIDAAAQVAKPGQAWLLFTAPETEESRIRDQLTGIRKIN